MTLKVELANKAASSWTDITDKVRIYDGMRVGGNAHLGEVGTGSGFDLDDDAGSLSLPVKRVLRVRDTHTSPNTILLRGRIAGKGVARGQMPVGDARAFDVELDDIHADLHGIPIRSWSRPEETDYERVIALWRKVLKGTRRASTRLRIDYVRNANRRTLPKQTYRDTDPYGIWADIAEAAGKEFFITVDREMFYDLPTSQRYAASLSITDDAPNMTTEFPPIFGAAGDQDGSEFISGATVTYGDKKRVSAVRSSVEAAHDYWRTIISEDATGEADARRRLKALLSRQAREDATYTLDLELTHDQIDLIKYGQTVSFRSAAVGVLSPVVLRVGRLMWEPTAPGHYIAHLELGFPKKLAPRIKRGGRGPGSGGTNPGNPTAPQGTTVTPPAATTRAPIDEFSRTTGGAITSVGTASGVSHVYSEGDTAVTISLPDGCDVVGRHLIACITAPYGTYDLYTPMVAAGWVRISGVTGTQLWQKRIDGSEGFTGTGDTFGFTVAGETLELASVIDLVESAYDEYPSNPGLWFTGPVTSVTSDPDDVPSKEVDWSNAPGRVYVIVMTDGTSPTAGPAGYIEMATDAGTSVGLGMYALDNDPPDAEDPGAVTASGVDLVSTFMVRGGGVTGWGSIPRGYGVDTDAPWPGGNTYDMAVVGASADYYVDGGHGVIVITGDGTYVRARLKTASSLDQNGEPWGPWDGAVLDFAMKFRINLNGDLSDTDPNYILATVESTHGVDSFRIFLGDGMDWNTSTAGAIPNATRGFALDNSATGTTWSNFQAQTLTVDTWYWMRWNLLGSTAKGKLWLASETEPEAWAVSVARADYDDYDDYSRLNLYFQGNITNGDMELDVDGTYALVADPAAAGTAGEVYGVTAVTPV